MIVKNREKPLIIFQLEALLRRLPDEHPKKSEIHKELLKRKAGYRGEQSVDYYLSLLDEEKYDVYQDVRIFKNKNVFQIDTLLVTDYFLMILEIKNISGTIHFDSLFNQLIRTIDGKEEGFKNPLSQLTYQKNMLSDWLLDHKFPLFPFETAVVISNPSTIIKTMNGQSSAYQRIFHASNLADKLKRLDQIYKNPLISPAGRKKLKKLLLKNHTPAKSDLLNRFQISKTELVTGIACSNCHTYYMEHIYGKWKCGNCLYESKDAHLEAIDDYFLLISPFITNREFRWFTNLFSPTKASRMLSALNLTSKGYKKTSSHHQISQPSAPF
ncbi:NERD domain-containing protein [Metabacillus sp. GX 13764]|uniref:nuclease-related domain-containing protein n=1 Tax=Metabacillus kandeliae TaxID=2900151 RepID=UPI001E3C41BF|nr:nuclease-related domain-containing protein [Metabacillus kandeliae]MCD7035620.1 NERD domain-containing protein [Metabacillus kandeliae]